MATEDSGMNDNAKEFLMFTMDCRARLDPPVSENYFGNCLLPVLVRLRHRELVGEDGFFLAAAQWQKRSERGAT